MPDLVELAGVVEEPISREVVAVSTTPVGLRPPNQARVALIQVQDAAVRVMVTGQDPTTSLGLRVGPDGLLRARGLPSIQGLRFVRDDVADATLEVVYFSGLEMSAEAAEVLRRLTA